MNYHGLENPQVVSALCLLLRPQKKNVVFLLMTKLSSGEFSIIKWKVEFSYAIGMDANGRKIGLWAL